MKKLIFIITLLINSLLIHSQCFNVSNVYSFNYNGHTYKVIKEDKTWTEAFNCAISDNGYLTEINDLNEQNAIFSEIVNNANIAVINTTNEFGTAAVWIGGSDSQNEGTWIWDDDNDNNGVQFWSGGINGTPTGGLYSNWGTNPPEPDNSGGDQDKLTLTIDMFHPNYGKWNDLTNNIFNYLFFIIEYNEILSVEENVLKDKIKIYPNPFNDFININSQLELIDITISNTLGQIIYAKKPLSNMIKVELPNLESGIYYLQLLLKDGNSVSYKIIR